MLELIKKVVGILALLLPRWLKARDEAKHDAVRAGIASGDKEAVNEAFQKLLKVVIVCAGVLCVNGCRGYTVVAADREMMPMVHEGVEGWFVPNAVMLEIYEKLAD